MRRSALLLLAASVLADQSPPSAPAAPLTAAEAAAAVAAAGHHATDTLFFLVLVLLVGVFTVHVLKITRVPYTALLLLWGLLGGLITETFARHWPLLGPGIHAWEGISPDLLLAGFLPTLLFAGAFALQWHVVRRQLPSALLLAGPGVVLGTGLTAALVRATFPHAWSWPQCLLFGAMFSATDPVAVVAVLREAGLSKRLRTLVDLEALLNDGTAYVLFFVLRRFVAAGATGAPPPTAGDTVAAFAQLSVGGVAVGLAFGWMTTAWLRYMYNDPMPEIMLTIVSAYMTYLVGDRLLGVSGVLAVVALGLWMSAFGVNYVSRKVEAALEVVWDVLEYCANTLIFVLSGAMIASRIYTNVTNPNLTDLSLADLPFALVLWLYLLLVRALMFVLFAPVLTRAAYGLSLADMVVLSWSGLRGAVGLALSLFVLLDTKDSPDVQARSFGTLCFYYMSATCLLTLLVQGVTMAPLLRGLGMTKPPSVRRSFLKQLLRGVEARGDDALALAAGDDLLGEPDWRAVGELAALDARAVLQRYASVGHADAHGKGGGGAHPRTPAGFRAAVTAAFAFLDPRRLAGRRRTASADGLPTLARHDAMWTTHDGLPAPPAASAAAAAVEAHERAVAMRLNRGALLAERRGRFLAAVRATYADLFADAYINSTAIFVLRGAADRASDALGRPLCDYDLLAPSLALPRWTAALARRADWRWLAAPAHRALLASLDQAATLLLAFIHAHDVTATDFVDVWGDALGGDDPVPVAAASPSLTADALLGEMKANVARQVLAESRAEVGRAAAALARLRAAWPEVLRSIKTRQLAQALLLLKEKRVSEVARTGLLADNERQQLTDLVEKKFKRLHFAPPRVPPPANPADALRGHRLLRGLTPEDADAVVKASTLFIREEGAPLCAAGAPATHVVLIVRGLAVLAPASASAAAAAGPSSRTGSAAITRLGSVRGAGSPTAARAGSGAFGGGAGGGAGADAPPSTAGAGAILFAAPALLRVPHDAAATAASVVIGYRVPTGVLEAAMAGSDAVRLAAWRAAAAGLAALHGGPALAGRPYADLDAAFRSAREEDVSPGEPLRVAGAAFLVYGRVAKAAVRGGRGGPPAPDAPVLAAPAMLPADPAVYSALTGVKVFHLPTGALPGLAGGSGDGGDDGDGGGSDRGGGRPPSIARVSWSREVADAADRADRGGGGGGDRGGRASLDASAPPPAARAVRPSLAASWRGARDAPSARALGLATLPRGGSGQLALLRGDSPPPGPPPAHALRPHTVGGGGGASTAARSTPADSAVTVSAASGASLRRELRAALAAPAPCPRPGAGGDPLLAVVAEANRERSVRGGRRASAAAEARAAVEAGLGVGGDGPGGDGGAPAVHTTMRTGTGPPRRRAEGE